jgi:hypothetical protein
MQIEAQQAMISGRSVSPYFVLRVSREKIVTDTLTQLLLVEDRDLKKPLKVLYCALKSYDDDNNDDDDSYVELNNCAAVLCFSSVKSCREQMSNVLP